MQPGQNGPIVVIIALVMPGHDLTSPVQRLASDPGRNGLSPEPGPGEKQVATEVGMVLLSQLPLQCSAFTAHTDSLQTALVRHRTKVDMPQIPALSEQLRTRAGAGVPRGSPG